MTLRLRLGHLPPRFVALRPQSRLMLEWRTLILPGHPGSAAGSESIPVLWAAKCSLQVDSRSEGVVLAPPGGHSAYRADSRTVKPSREPISAGSRLSI